MNMEDYIKVMHRYCEINNMDDYDKKRDLMQQEFGDWQNKFEDLLEGLPKGAIYMSAGSFDSPGYDIDSYAVAWIEDGKVRLETFVLEYF